MYRYMICFKHTRPMFKRYWLCMAMLQLCCRSIWTPLTSPSKSLGYKMMIIDIPRCRLLFPQALDMVELQNGVSDRVIIQAFLTVKVSTHTNSVGWRFLKNMGKFNHRDRDCLFLIRPYCLKGWHLGGALKMFRSSSRSATLRFRAVFWPFGKKLRKHSLCLLNVVNPDGRNSKSTNKKNACKSQAS